MAEKKGRGRLVAAGLGALALAGLVYAVIRAQALPEGPEPVAWDKTACAHCHMHVSEPSFAAQLHTKGGEVLHFDDPGCLFLYLDQRKPDVHATWFHHSREDRWVNGTEVRFREVPETTTPMGYGLAAAGLEEPDAKLGMAEARARVTAGGAQR